MLKTDTIQITPELLALISELDGFKGPWRALGTLMPERLKALRHVAAIKSSKLTDRGVERLLANVDIKKLSTHDAAGIAISIVFQMTMRAGENSCLMYSAHSRSSSRCRARRSIERWIRQHSQEPNSLDRRH